MSQEHRGCPRVCVVGRGTHTGVCIGMSVGELREVSCRDPFQPYFLEGWIKAPANPKGGM